MKCPKCGYFLPEDSEFCQYCGIYLNLQPSSVMPTEEAAISTEDVPPTMPILSGPISEPVSEIVPVTLQSEASQDESLFRRAYNSYLSCEPDERRFFEELLGSEELKSAYLEECDRNQKEYDKGIRISYKQSYTDFMGILHDKYTEVPPVPQVSYEKSELATEPIIPTAASVVKTATSSNGDARHTFCKKCGADIDPTTKKCSGCGKQYFRAKTTIPLVFLSVLLIASIGLNVMQYLQGKAAIETVESQMTKIEELEKTVASQKNTISSQKNTITSQKTTISTQENAIASLVKKSGYFDTIRKELSSGNLGYAASNFRASESIIIVNKNEINRKFTLTANWTISSTVSVDYSGRAAIVTFDNYSWTTSTKMTIEPLNEGVTVVTFSNNVDSKTFKLLIIVTD